MFRGKIVEEGTADEIFYHPSDPYTKHLLASVPHLGRARPASMDAVAAPEIEPKPVLVVENLDVKFPGRIGSPPVHAVDGVSLELRAHEILALVGESGSGKTTLGRCAVGLLPPSGGRIEAFGEDITKASARALRTLRRRMGFVFQDPAASLNPRMSVGACISEPMRIHAEGTKDERRERVAELLDAVELPRDYADRYPHELSGGQRQRVSLARALIMGPELLVADDPTSALDVSVQARVLEVFVRLQHLMGFACLFITHDLAVVDMLADRIAVMQGGKLVEIGTGEQILRTPRQDYTKELIAAVPLPDPKEQAVMRDRRRALRAEAHAAG
jgi:peptide/nickel transport system ATP-binding protein